MKKVRRGMFETNSSSTHTIIITDQNCEPGALVDFQIGEFGWSHHILSTIDEKASYLYTLACECYNRDVYQDLYEILVKYGVDCECSRPAVFKKYDGYEYLDNGYVDHCYEGRDFVDAIFHSERRLIRYLFSDESFVITGNDNCDEDEYEKMEKEANVPYDHEEYYKGN